METIFASMKTTSKISIEKDPKTILDNVDKSVTKEIKK